MEFETLAEAEGFHADAQSKGAATEIDGCKVTILIPSQSQGGDRSQGNRDGRRGCWVWVDSTRNGDRHRPL